MAEPEGDRKTLKSLFTELTNDRSPYLDRARRGAELTVPYLVPGDGDDGSTEYPEPSHGLGARGVRHLASKLQMALFPVNAPFFKYTVDDITLEELTKQTGLRGEVEKALDSRTRAVIAEMEGSMFRPVSFEACRQLIVAGNYLMHVPNEGHVRGFRLRSYVVRRDGNGMVLDIVVKEEMARASVPEDIRAKLPEPEGGPEKASAARDEPIELYTHVKLTEDGKSYEVYQEVEGILVDETPPSHPANKPQWIPLRFTVLEGEDYGRGFVDEYAGDLASLDAFAEAIRDGTVQAAKVVWLVAPNATTSPSKLARAENGTFVQGREGEVVPLRLDKSADFAVAERLIGKIEERIAFAFLLNTAVQRPGERVTAEEVRYMASELDMGLGGVYSLQSEEFQRPIAVAFEARMEKARNVPPLPKGATSLVVTTGLDALGRGNDLQNLDVFLRGLLEAIGPQGMAQYVNAGEYIKRRAAALGIDADGLIRTDEEIAQAQEQAQAMQMMEKLGPQGIAQAGGAIRDGMKAEQAPA